MKAYWDSSALVEATSDLNLRVRLRAEGGLTRTHALAETFSALTSGNLAIRVDADAAAETIENLAEDLEFVDLSAKETLAALKQARKRESRYLPQRPGHRAPSHPAGARVRRDGTAPICPA